MFEVIFLIVVSLYFILLVFISSGLNRKFVNDPSFKPFVSVVLAARNEESYIVECLSSLHNQSYEKYEVIIADDFSTDNTGILIDNFISNKKNFKKITPALNTSVPGKMNAVASALKYTMGEIILFTDADCTLPEKWIEDTVHHYSSKTAMVNGFTITDADNIISGIQRIDLIFLISVAAGMANHGIPVSCIGNNMSVRRKVLDETGGYSSYGNSVTEDYMLLNKVSSLKKYDIIFPPDPDRPVKTKAHKKLLDVYRQKKRWASGGLASLNISLSLMIISYLVNLMMVLSFFFYSSTALMLISLKIFSEFFFLKQVHKRLNLDLNLLYFIFFEVYYIIYTTVLPVILLFSRTITWKGRKY